MPRKKRKKPKEETYSLYEIAVERWDYSYHFGTNAFSRDDGCPYSAIHNFSLEGRLLDPQHLKVNSACLYFTVNKRLDEPRQSSGTNVRRIGRYICRLPTRQSPHTDERYFTNPSTPEREPAVLRGYARFSSSVSQRHDIQLFI
jgi:hypothetical protein